MVLGIADAHSPTGLSLPGLHHAAPTGYLFSDSTTVLFVQWTQTGTDLAGTLDIAYLPPNGATEVKSETDSFTGVLSNGNVTLTIDKSVLGATNLSGTFDGSTLTLSIPNPDGSLGQAQLTSAALSDYNSDVAALQSQAGQNLSAQQQAQQQQQAAQALAAAEKKVDGAIATVEDDLQGLTQDTDFSSELGGVSSDLAQTNANLATTQKAAQAEEAEAQQYPSGNYGQVCADAGGVSADAGGVSADAGGVEASANSVELDLRTARNDISSLQADFAAIASTEANVPQYHPANPPTTNQINAAVAAAQQAIAQALATTNGEIDQANADTAAAYAATAQAYQAGNCGPAPTAPKGQSHIS